MASHPFFLFGGFVLLEFYLVGELTHMRSMCVGVAETGSEHCSPAKKRKDTFFFIVLFSEGEGSRWRSRDRKKLNPLFFLSILL